MLNKNNSCSLEHVSVLIYFLQQKEITNGRSCSDTLFKAHLTVTSLISYSLTF